jgi:hypothetical protein
MGLDVWFREDVARALRAALVAGREAHWGLTDGNRPTALSREMAAYWRGYEAALATIGTAFGLTSPIADPVIGQEPPFPYQGEGWGSGQVPSSHLKGTAPPPKANSLARPWGRDVTGEWE